MKSKEPKPPLSTDQRRLRVILAIILGMVILLALGVGWIAVGIGLPWWLAVIIALTIAIVVGLFTILNLM